MLVNQIWECDLCGKRVGHDGFPKEWFEVEICKGDYFHGDEGIVLSKDCCSQECVDLALNEYLKRAESGENKS